MYNITKNFRRTLALLGMGTSCYLLFIMSYVFMIYYHLHNKLDIRNLMIGIAVISHVIGSVFISIEEVLGNFKKYNVRKLIIDDRRKAKICNAYYGLLYVLNKLCGVLLQTCFWTFLAHSIIGFATKNNGIGITFTCLTVLIVIFSCCSGTVWIIGTSYRDHYINNLEKLEMLD
jgi:hypothetical protein